MSDSGRTVAVVSGPIRMLTAAALVLGMVGLWLVGIIGAVPSARAAGGHDDPVSTITDAWFYCVVTRSTQDFRTAYTSSISCVFPAGWTLHGGGDTVGEWTASGPRSDTRCSATDGGGSCTGSGQYGIVEWNYGSVTYSGASGSFLRWEQTSQSGFDPSGSYDYLNPSDLSWRPDLTGNCSAQTSWLQLDAGMVYLDLDGGSGSACRPGYMVYSTTATPAWDDDYFNSSGNPVYSGPAGEGTLSVVTTGVIEEGTEVDFLLEGAYDGEDVTCTGQAAPTGSPATGTIGDPDDPEEFTFSMTWADSGVYAVECVWDGHGGDDDARAIVTVGAGLADVIDDGCNCGAWWNVACHTGCVLRWAFVPSDDTVSTFADTVSTAFPFSLGADLLDTVDSLGDFEGASVRPGVELPAYVPGLNDPTATFTILGPDVDDTPGNSVGTTCSYDSDLLGATPNCYNWDSDVEDLWGYRVFLRTLALVVMYVGVAWALWRRFERLTEDGGA